MRSGLGIRPWSTVTRSVEKYSPLGLPSRAGGASPGTPGHVAVAQNLQGPVEADHVHGTFDTGDPRHGLVDLLREPGLRDRTELGEHLHVRRVGAGQIRGEGRLRAPCAGHRGHGDAAHETDEQHQREVARPAPAESGPEPVGGLAHDRWINPDPSSSSHLVTRASALSVSPNGGAPPRWVPRRPGLVLAPGQAIRFRVRSRIRRSEHPFAPSAALTPSMLTSPLWLEVCVVLAFSAGPEFVAAAGSVPRRLDLRAFRFLVRAVRRFVVRESASVARVSS